MLPFIGRDTYHRERLVDRHARHKDETAENGKALFRFASDFSLFDSLSSSFFSLLCKTDRVAHITRLLFCGRFDRMNLPIDLLHKVICCHHTVDIAEKRLDGCVDFASLSLGVEKDLSRAVLQLDVIIFQTLILKRIDVPIFQNTILPQSLRAAITIAS